MFLPSVTVFHPWSTTAALFHLDCLHWIFIFFDEKQYNKQNTKNPKQNKKKEKKREDEKKEKEKKKPATTP